MANRPVGYIFPTLPFGIRSICAIRLGKGQWTGLVSQAFLPVDAYVVASPDFLCENTPFRHPADMLRHLLIGPHHQPDCRASGCVVMRVSRFNVVRIG